VVWVARPRVAPIVLRFFREDGPAGRIFDRKDRLPIQLISEGTGQRRACSSEAHETREEEEFLQSCRSPVKALPNEC
jgi:hypothetical protein